MSTIIALCKTIELPPTRLTSFNIKLTKNSPNADLYPLLYKVKTNLKQAIDVRPSFGFLSPQQSIVELQVKYSGVAEDIPKGKILINWVRAPRDIQDNRMPHSEFSMRYKEGKCDSAGQGSLMLQLVEQQTAYQGRREEIRYAPQQDEEYTRNSSITSQQENVEQPMEIKKVDSPVKQKQEEEGKLPGISVEGDNATKGLGKQQRKGLSLPIVLVLVLVSLLVGISIGVKMERMMGEQKVGVAILQPQPEPAEDLPSEVKVSQSESVPIVAAPLKNDSVPSDL